MSDRTSPTMLQPTLDTIKPRLGGVKGNLRWICYFVNVVDRSNEKECPLPRRWTPELFAKYIQVV